MNALSQTDAVTQKTLSAVKCEACGRLHETSSEGWITIFGAWQQGTQPVRRSFIGKTFGTYDVPTVACNSNGCILRVLGREGHGEY